VHQLDLAQDEGASCRDAAALLLDYYRLRAVYLAYPTVKGQSQIDDVFATAVKGLKATHEAAWYESLKDYYQKAVAFGLAVHYPRDAVSLKVTIEGLRQDASRSNAEGSTESNWRVKKRQLGVW
jgi:hypothetical protein